MSRYGIEASRLRFVTDTSNVVFRVDSATGRFTLRIDPEPPTDRRFAMHTEEMLWLAALRRDTTLAIPEGMAPEGGAAVQLVSTPAVPEGRLVTVLRWMPGTLVSSRPTRKVMAQMGACMAYLHCHAEKFSLPPGCVRSHLAWDALRSWPDRNPDTSCTLTPRQRDLCATVAGPLATEIGQLEPGNDYGLVHADIHPYNCLRHEGQLQIIDFADCCLASYFYDLAVPLTYVDGREDYQTLRTAFYAGYLQVRPLPREFESTVQLFMVARALDMIEWINSSWTRLAHYSEIPRMVTTAMQRIERYALTLDPG